MALSVFIVIASLVLSTAQGAATPSNTKGCGTKHSFAGKTQEFGINSNGRHRTYRLHLPSKYDAKTPTPLLIAYHGNGNEPVKFEGQTRFSDESVNPHMIAVYPAGVNNSWQGAPYAVPHVNDEAFTMDLLTHIKDHYCIDESRVYASGHSNGGGFCDVLACSRDVGAQFAAFAPISGAFYTEFQGNAKCDAAAAAASKSWPRPMFEVHGTGDKRIPYDGRKSGGNGPLPSIPAWVSAWAKRNGCSAPVATDLGHGVHDYRYECRGIVDGLEHIKVDGMSHAWPGPGSPLQDVSARVIGFLNKHHRGGEMRKRG
ncbi:hypothetical protein E4U09_005273 [Claviceps aff. purpurea]|uniref:feruloyl esterase n=1 Tax=Claviceps aff. purpurea TaxID=1967640 RepID=A0A9P7QNP5_9HYPO|nr:hypothetical protein E4U09_005273 [Claviceps aff. purpurea]